MSETSQNNSKRPLRYLYVHLADDEWGNELMTRVARQEFESRAFPDDLVVMVYEHAGWYLAFRRDGAVVESANDFAGFPAEVREWRRSFSGESYAGSVRRESGTKAPGVTDSAVKAVA